MNALKRSLFTLALAAGVSSSALFAQPPADQPPGPPPGEHGERKGPGGGQRGDRLKMLAEALELTEEQKTLIKPIALEEAAAIKTIREDQSLDREAKLEKFKAVQATYSPKIEAHLTPEQKVKFEKIKSDMRAQGGRGGKEKK